MKKKMTMIKKIYLIIKVRDEKKIFNYVMRKKYKEKSDFRCGGLGGDVAMMPAHTVDHLESNQQQKKV
jgi:hypothetical protein